MVDGVISVVLTLGLLSRNYSVRAFCIISQVKVARFALGVTALDNNCKLLKHKHSNSNEHLHWLPTALKHYLGNKEHRSLFHREEGKKNTRMSVVVTLCITLAVLLHFSEEKKLLS